MELRKQISKIVEDRIRFGRTSTYLVVSALTYSALRIELLGITYALNSPETRPNSYCVHGKMLKIVQLDNDYETILLVG